MLGFPENRTTVLRLDYNKVDCAPRCHSPPYSCLSTPGSAMQPHDELIFLHVA